MSLPTPTYASLDECIAREAIPFSVDSPKIFKAVVDTVMAPLGDTVELLGFGEALMAGRTFSSSATGSSSAWWRRTATAPSRAVFPERAS